MNTKRFTEAIAIAKQAIESFEYALKGGEAPDESNPLHKVILDFKTLAEEYLSLSSELTRKESHAGVGDEALALMLVHAEYGDHKDGYRERDEAWEKELVNRYTDILARHRQSAQVKPCESVEDAVRRIFNKCIGTDSNDVTLFPDYKEAATIIQHILDKAVAEARQAQWQDIETAPKDGCRILLGCPSRDVFEGVVARCFWSKDLKKWWDWVCPDKPTHWMPLPCPPITDNLEGE